MFNTDVKTNKYNNILFNIIGVKTAGEDVAVELQHVEEMCLAHGEGPRVARLGLFLETRLEVLEEGDRERSGEARAVAGVVAEVRERGVLHRHRPGQRGHLRLQRGEEPGAVVERDLRAAAREGLPRVVRTALREARGRRR